MVMHARKYQRLNDGYYERGQAHPYEEKNSSKHRHYDDRYGESKRESPNFRYGNSSADGRGSTRDRDDSPASRSGDRYQNKASYTERNKDKQEKGNRSNKDGRNREQKERDHRAEVRKSAVRVCGDWSEHVSSSGKYYYYNCKTEVSRWEKPKEWNDKIAGIKSESVQIKENKDRRAQHGHPIKTYDERQKHSISATATSSSSDHHHRTNQQTNSRGSATFGSPGMVRHHSFDQSDQSQKYRQLHSHATSGVNISSNNNSSQNKSGHPSHRTGVSNANAWQVSDHGKRDSVGVYPSSADRTYSTPERPNQIQDSRSNSTGSTPIAHHHHLPHRNMGHTTDYNGSKHDRNDYEDSRQAEDMDISPGSTPTEESMMDRHVPSMTNTVSTPVSMVTGTPPSVSRPSASLSSNLLSMLSSLTSMSNLSDLPALASLSSLTATSPGGTATSPASLLPQLLQQLTGGRSMSNAHPHPPQNQQVLKQAIQVLQQMQQTLLMQQKQQQQRKLQQLLVTQLHQLQQQLQTQGKPSDHPEHTQHAEHSQHSHHPSGKASAEDESDGTPIQSPEHNNGIITGPTQHLAHLDRCRESPPSENSLKSSRRGSSPTPSHTSSQTVSLLGTSQLTAAHRKQESIHLSSSLAQYYDKSLINHVSGLLYDQTERQSDLVAEEAHTIGSLMVSQLSVDLKGARSLVRAGEIISTSHEQRILFIRQQIKDLDNWRTQTTFMPSSSSSSHEKGHDV